VLLSTSTSTAGASGEACTTRTCARGPGPLLSSSLQAAVTSTSAARLAARYLFFIVYSSGQSRWQSEVPRGAGATAPAARRELHRRQDHRVDHVDDAVAGADISGGDVGVPIAHVDHGAL